RHALGADEQVVEVQNRHLALGLLVVSGGPLEDQALAVLKHLAPVAIYDLIAHVYLLLTHK
ncbi:MAG: hypothetical protein EDM74_12210, partial [Armatimonadetes bacterium]